MSGEANLHSLIAAQATSQVPLLPDAGVFAGEQRVVGNRKAVGVVRTPGLCPLVENEASIIIV